MPVKVCDINGMCPETAIMNGIRWAANQDADVANMSFGKQLTYFGMVLVRDAVDYAHSQGVVMIAIAGNNWKYFTTRTRNGSYQQNLTM